ncbi:MAG: YceI family protein [Cyclobacteriaceae bacterium]
MKKSVLLSVVAAFVISVAGYAQDSDKLVSSKSHIKFFSTTPAEDIEANNTAAVSTINKSTGDVVFSVPMQGFEFDKSLMQKHFNNDKFLDTQTHPKAKLKGKITNLDEIDFSNNGTYDANVEGELTIKGKTNPVKEKGTVTIKDGQIKVYSQFDVTLADYGIVFKKGKPASNIAETVEVTVNTAY